MMVEIRNHISAIRENLAKAGVFRWVTNIHEHKRYYYAFDNSLLFTENIRTLHKSFHANVTSVSSSIAFPGRWHNMQWYALNPVCVVLIIPGRSRRSSRQGC